MATHKFKSRRKTASAAALAVTVNRAMELLDVGRTHFYGKVLPELEVYYEGSSPRITLRSINKRIERKLKEAATA